MVLSYFRQWRGVGASDSGIPRIENAKLMDLFRKGVEGQWSAAEIGLDRSRWRSTATNGAPWLWS